MTPLLAAAILALAALHATAHVVDLRSAHTGQNVGRTHARSLESVDLAVAGTNELVTVGNVEFGANAETFPVLFSTTAPYSWLPVYRPQCQQFKKCVNYNDYGEYCQTSRNSVSENTVLSQYSGTLCGGLMKVGPVTVQNLSETLLVDYYYTKTSIPWAPTAVQYPYNGVFALPYTKNANVSFMAAAKAQGLIQNNRFAFVFPSTSFNAQFYFDTIPDNVLTGVLHEPVSLNDYWSVKSIGIEIGDERILSTPVDVAFDPSFTFSYFQQFIGNSIYSAINKTLTDLGQPLASNVKAPVQVACNLVPRLPNFSIYTRGFKITVTPKQYTKEVRINILTTRCYFNFLYFLQNGELTTNLGKNQPQAIFGLDFFQGLTVLYDQDASLIGAGGSAVAPMAPVKPILTALAVFSIVLYCCILGGALAACARARSAKRELIVELQKVAD